MDQILTTDVSFSFHPYHDKRALFIKMLEAFEQSDLVPRLEYVGTRYSTNGIEVREKRLSDRAEWINDNDIDKWGCLRSSTLKDMIIYCSYPPTNYVAKAPVEVIAVWIEKMKENYVPRVKKIIVETETLVDLLSGRVLIYDNSNIPGFQVEAYLHDEPAPYGLPYFAEPVYLPSLSIPWCIDWINYWNNDTLATIGFNPDEDKKLFYDATKMSKGWYLQLTQEPFNFENPEHIERLRKVYFRFKKIGGQDLIEQGLVPRG